ncbi:MAG: TatD family deoxyribonuclease, partial [Mycoplasma sp.]|nr:TatD family deoxyribonuclease [Mycoplasma sp.]
MAIGKAVNNKAGGGYQCNFSSLFREFHITYIFYIFINKKANKKLLLINKNIKFYLIMYIDTHCHLFSPYFDQKTTKEAIQKAKNNNVTHLIIPSVRLEDWDEIKILIENNLNIYGAIGLHPSNAIDDINKLNEYINKIDFKNVVAIGEIGLDFYRQTNPTYAIQKLTFEFFLDICIKKNLPAIIHMRQAEQEVYDILKKDKYKTLKFVLHSFTSSLEWANKFLSLGGYISFNGIVTFKNAKDIQNLAKNIETNKILIETDAPFLTPMPHRG